MNALPDAIAQALAPWTPPTEAQWAAAETLDAARYRHLRNLAIEKTGMPGQPCIAMPNGMQSGYYLTEETADFAVDTSMEQAAIAADLEAVRRKDADPFRQAEADAAMRREIDFDQMQRSLSK